METENPPLQPGEAVIVFLPRTRARNLAGAAGLAAGQADSGPVVPVLAAVSRVFATPAGWQFTIRHSSPRLGGTFDVREALPVRVLESLPGPVAGPVEPLAMPDAPFPLSPPVPAEKSALSMAGAGAGGNP